MTHSYPPIRLAAVSLQRFSSADVFQADAGQIELFPRQFGSGPGLARLMEDRILPDRQRASRGR
jgi:hypothetical protein